MGRILSVNFRTSLVLTTFSIYFLDCGNKQRFICMHSSKGYSCQAALSIYNQIALNGLQEIKYSGNESGLDSKLVVNTAL